MPVKIRLQRHGKKGKPFYWIVAADVRAKRDGKFLEKIGIYNPNTNPATVEVSVDKALHWLENGAQPTNTAKTLLSYRGVMLKHHLQGGVRKGAFSQEEAEKRFNEWLEEKNAKIQAKVDGLNQKEADERTVRLAAEKEISDKRKAVAIEASTEDQTENETVAASDVETSDIEKSDVTNETESVNEEPTEKTSAEEEAPVEDKSPTASQKDVAPPAQEEIENTPQEEASAEKAPSDAQQDEADEDSAKEA